MGVLGIIGIFLILIIIREINTFRVNALWESVRKECEQKGLSFDFRDIIPDQVPKDKNFAFLFETSELYDRMYKLIKSDLDLLVENVDKEIIDYFNKLIVINDFGLFKIRTSSYTSETATYYNTEEDMKKVLSEIPEEDRRRFEKKLIAYKKQWEKISITPPKN